MSSIKIVGVDAKNFLSYKELRYELPNKGIIMIEGVNTDSKEYSDSNGAGKSTLFDAIYWALFEKWTRRSQYRSGRVVNDSVGRDCSVAVSLVVDGSPYSVIRFCKDTQYNNGLFLYSQNERTGELHDLKMTIPATQDRIEKLFGISWEVFFNTVMFGGGRFKSFIEATDSDKKQIYEDMLGVSVFSRAREIVRTDLQELQKQEKDLQDKIRQKSAECEKIKSDIADAEFKAKQYEDNVRRDIEDLKQQWESTIANKNNLLLQKSQLEKQFQLENTKVGELNVRLAAITEAYDGNMKKLMKITEDINSLETNRRVLQYKISDIEKSITRFESLGDVCPTCERPVHSGEFKGKISELVTEKEECMKEIKLLDDKLVELRNNSSVVNAELVAEKANIDRVKREFDDLCATVRSRPVEIGRINDNIEYHDKKLSEINLEIEKINNYRTNMWLEVISKLSKDLDVIKEELIVLESNHKSLHVLKPVLEFWDEGFSPRGMESFLFETVLPELNEKMREYTDVLFAGNVVIKILPTSKIKKGDLREKISFEVSGLNLDTASDGELRRMDIAMLLANNYLLRKRVDVNVLLLDQVFETLDSTGCDAVVRLLDCISNSIPNIFVITHNPDMSHKFGNVWRVIKSNGISSLHVR